MKRCASEKAVDYYLAHPEASLREVGRRFGISGERVRQKIVARGLKTRSHTAATDAAIHAVSDLASRTPCQVASETGLPVKTVVAALRRLGIAYPTTIDRNAGRSHQMIQEARKGEKTITDLSIEFDMAYVTVARALRSVGIKTPFMYRRTGAAAKGSAIVDAEGVSIYEAAKRVGCAPDPIRAYRVLRGLPVRAVPR